MTKAFFGLPEEVVFCKRCVISNQRPNSTVEFKNVKEEEKATINFDKKVFVTHVDIRIQRLLISIGKKEMKH